MRTTEMDLGQNHTLEFMSWAPDRALNPHYADLPDVARYGAIVRHDLPGGTVCKSSITFTGPVAAYLQPEAAVWQVLSLEPV